MLQLLANLADTFAETPMIASREMRRLLDTDRTAFTEAVMALCKTKAFSAGHQYALTLLVTNSLIVDRLADPRGLEAPEATEIARRISSSIDSFLDVKLIRLLVPNNGTPAAITDSAAFLRVLEIIGAISDGSRIMTLLTQLLQHPDNRVRSKVALLIGRINHNLQWVEQRLSESDARVRANAIESLWGLDSPESRLIFTAAIEDADNRVAGNGALGLYRCGDLAAADALTRMLGREEPKFRASAAWAMGESADPRFLSQLSLRIAETDTLVRQNVFRAISKIRKRIKEVQDLGRLSVVITRTETAGTQRKINFAVTRDPRQPVTKLNASEIVISDGGSLVNQFNMVIRREAEHVVAGLVVPRLINSEESGGQAIFEAVRVFLRRKRKLDSWTATKYAAVPVQQGPAFRLESALLASGSGGASQAAVAEPEVARDLEPIRFTSDPRAILQMCESVGLKVTCAESPLEAVQRLMDAITLVRGHRFVFLVLDERWDQSWNDILPRLRDARIGLFALALQTAVSEDLDRVCFESGGASVAVDSPDKLVPAAERMAAALESLYTLEYEMPKPGSNGVKLQVYTEQGFGEDSVGI
jgi:HEAT repeat protein